jgi:hypothetical protein
MIKTKQDLKEYLNKDKFALSQQKRFPSFFSRRQVKKYGNIKSFLENMNIILTINQMFFCYYTTVISIKNKESNWALQYHAMFLELD